MGKERKQGTGVFSEKLRELMKKNSLTQQELADSIGIARQTVGKYLDGLCYPQANILSKISVKYGVSIDYLVMGIESKSELLSEYIDLQDVPLKDDIIRYITRPEATEYITLDDYGNAEITENQVIDYSANLETIADEIALKEIEKDLAILQKRYREMMRSELEKIISEQQKEG